MFWADHDPSPVGHVMRRFLSPPGWLAHVRECHISCNQFFLYPAWLQDKGVLRFRCRSPCDDPFGILPLLPNTGC